MGIVVRVVTDCSWVSAEELLDRKVSDTTLRARFKDWTEARVFEGLVDEAIEGYDRVVGLDLSDCAVDGSQHKAPLGGEGTGKNPTDRAKTGWKWSLFTERNGIPLGWATAGANRNDFELLEPTLVAVLERGRVTPRDAPVTAGNVAKCHGCHVVVARGPCPGCAIP